MGSIRKRGSTWTFRIDLARDAEGKRRQLVKGGFRTKAEATAAMAEMTSGLNSGTFTRPTKESIGGFLRRWLETRKPSLKPTTWASYEQLIRTHILPKIGGERLQDLTPEILNLFYANLLAYGRLTGAGGALSTRTVRYIHTILRRALKDAVRWRLLTVNVCDYADPPPSKPTEEMKVWSLMQLRQFLDHVRDDRHCALWLLAASTGMRRGEITGLRWGDCDLDRARIAVTQTVVLVRSKITFSTPKTTKGRRSIPLDLTTVAALRQHRKRQLETRLASGAAFKDHDLVFSAEDGGPVNPETIANMFQSTAKAAGLPLIRLHDLRHSYASIALAAGVHPRVVADRLGHSDVKVTLSTYSHVLPGVHEEAAEKVASAILGTGS